MRQVHRSQAAIDICKELEHYDLHEVARAAGVRHSTLYKWMDGSIVAPRSDTLELVAEVIGMELYTGARLAR